MFPAAQLFEHEPQCASDELGLTHCPLQQRFPTAQTLPQVPQLFSSDWRFTQAFAAAQQVVPLAQPEPPVQAPAPLQVSPLVQPLASLHELPADFGA